jgi:hypothetical protein
MTNQRSVNFMIGGAIIATAITTNFLDNKRTKLEARISQLETNQTRLEQRYDSFTNQYAQTHPQTNRAPASLEQIYEAIMPPVNQPTSSIPQRNERTIDAINYANQLNQKQTAQ